MSQDHLPAPSGCQAGRKYLDMVSIHVAGGITEESIGDETVRVNTVN